MEMIPTKGRIVYFVNENNEEFAAIITKVFSPEIVNLQVFMDSMVVPYTSVRHGEGPRTWDWMPFQKDQQKRVEAMVDAEIEKKEANQ